MPTIEKNKTYTVLVEFEVEPEHQQQLIDALADQVEEKLRGYPGFISASFHATEDGRRIFNYAQWSSGETYKTFLERGSDQLEDVFNHFRAKLLKLDHPLHVVRVVESNATQQR